MKRASVLRWWVVCLMAGVCFQQPRARAAGRWPVLPDLIRAVRLDPSDATAAARLGSALVHRDWMLPVAERAEEVWTDTATTRQGEVGSLVSPDGLRRVDWNGNRLTLVSLPDGSAMAEIRTILAWETVQWHPGGWVLAVAGAQGLEIRDGQTLQIAAGECAGATGPALGFSRDGLFLVTGRRGGGIELWDWAMSRSLAVGLPGWGRVDRVAVSRDGSRVRIAQGERRQELDLRTGRALSDWHGATSVVGFATFTPDAGSIWTTSADGGVQLREAGGRGRGHRFMLPSPPVAVSISPDSRWMAVGDVAGMVGLWDLESGQPKGTPVAQGPVLDLALSSGGRWLWSASTNRVQAWPTASADVEPLTALGGERVHRLSRDASGLRLAVLSGDTNGYRVRLWAMTHPAMAPVTLPAWGPGVLDVHPQGEWILTSGPTGGVRQRKWSVGGESPGRPDLSPRSQFTGAAWSTDGTRIVTVDPGGAVRVWEAETGHLLGSRIEVPGVVIEGVELSPEGGRVRIEEVGGVVQVYDVASGRPSTEPWWPPVRRTRRVRGERQGFGGGGGWVLVPEGETGVRMAPLPPTGPAPAWLGEIAEAFWGAMDGGSTEVLDRVRAGLSAGRVKDRWTEWGAWLLADRGTRRAGPETPFSGKELALRNVETGMTAALVEAFRLCPEDASVRQSFVGQLRTNAAWGRPFRELQAERFGVGER
jgi:WD40 repeat protein